MDAVAGLLAFPYSSVAVLRRVYVPAAEYVWLAGTGPGRAIAEIPVVRESRRLIRRADVRRFGREAHGRAHRSRGGGPAHCGTTSLTFGGDAGLTFGGDAGLTFGGDAGVT